MATATKGMTSEEANHLTVNSRVRDLTCGREGVVVGRSKRQVQIEWDRVRPDGGEWLGEDESDIHTHDCDFMEKIEGRAER